MEELQKAIPFLFTTVVGYSLGLLTNLVKSWVDGIRERATIARESTAAHARLDKHETRILDLERVIKDMVPDLVAHIKNKGA